MSTQRLVHDFVEEFIHNSSKLEMSETSTTWWMEKHIGEGSTMEEWKEQSIATLNNMNERQNNYAESKNLEEKIMNHLLSFIKP